MKLSPVFLCLGFPLPVDADPTFQTTVYAGGVTGFDALADPAHSVEYRKAGGGLYLHNNGWSDLEPEKRKALLATFEGAPVGVELGFGNAEAWARHFSKAYHAAGIRPDFITVNCFDKDNKPTLDGWKAYTARLRKECGEKPYIFPTFEYANFGPNIPTLRERFLSKDKGFQSIVRHSKGIVIDCPPDYFFKREQNYRDWMTDAIQWTRKQGLASLIIVSPHHSGKKADEDAKKFVAYLREHGALPDAWSSENYWNEVPEGYPNQVTPETVPHTPLGVGLWLVKEFPPVKKPVAAPAN